jgi:hypothetical protein
MKAAALLVLTPYVVAGGLGWWLWRRHRKRSLDRDDEG